MIISQLNTASRSVQRRNPEALRVRGASWAEIVVADTIRLA
jgi:hypothetical protein